MIGGGRMIGGPGGPGGMGPGGMGPGGGQPNADADETETLVVVVVEIQNQSSSKAKNFKAGLIPLNASGWWGSAHIYNKQSRGISYEAELITTSQGAPLPTVVSRYQALLDKSRKEKYDTDKTVKDVARWALEHGLVEKFVELMDKLAETDKDHPSVKAYITVKKDLNRPLAKDDIAEKWKGQLLRDYLVTAPDDGHHFALIHAQDKEATEVKAHLDRLEKSFRSFYYWWAMRGVSLPVPKERQVAVWTYKGDDFSRLKKTLTSSPSVADSFFARRETLSVFNVGRGDNPYVMLDLTTKPLWERGFDRKLLLKTKRGYPKLLNDRPVQLPQIDAARTYALLLKAMEHEWEQTNTSHEVSRQQLFSSGLLPRKVNVPEWIGFGMGSFFETPLQSPWAASAAPSAYWLPRFTEYEKAGKYESSPRDTLVKLVKDGYFRGQPPLGDKATAKQRQDRRVEQRRARAAAWSLTYYLAQRDLPGLLRYFKELSRMPRDVELDDDVLLGAFARAFDCVDASKNVDMAKLGDLAGRWMAFTKNQRLEAEGVHAKIRTFYEKMTAPQPGAGGPGGPGGPGGFPGQ
jgi:hypothetical protein